MKNIVLSPENCKNSSQEQGQGPKNRSTLAIKIWKFDQKWTICDEGVEKYADYLKMPRMIIKF